MPARHTEKELAALVVLACRALDRRGLTAATDGNVSARLPSGQFLVTPSGLSKGLLEEKDLVVCDFRGRKVAGFGAVSLEIHLHLAAYRERPDVKGVVHAHPPIASAFTYAGREALFLEPILPEVVARLGPVPTAPYRTPGTPELAEAAAPLMEEHDAILLAQHGAITLGPDPWSAYLRMEKIEQAAAILKAASELAGSDDGIRRLAPRQVDELRRRYGG